jgi:hypothetical protein
MAVLSLNIKVKSNVWRTRYKPNFNDIIRNIDASYVIKLTFKAKIFV